MNMSENFSIKVKNYKCFGDEEQGFDRMRPINVIIGRNNSGKSTLLELVSYVVNPSDRFQELGHRGAVPEVFVTQPVQEHDLRSIFAEGTSGGGITGNHWRYGSKWINSIIKYKLQPDGKHSFIELDPPFQHTANLESHQRKLASSASNPLSGKIFKQMLAERNVASEVSGMEMRLDSNGEGATNIICSFINASNLPSELVEVKLLEELNKIYQPDSHFNRILVQAIEERTVWEVYLQEPSKGLVPLSHTGSGFKTILLVLVYLYLVPYIEGKDVADYIFAFEELENNLHPALQRRLLFYIREFAEKHGCVFFLTTHSNIVIDVFSRDDKAQIVHVMHDGEKASARCVQTYIDNMGILDDLDIRASDLLQANSVIWVEGPSDRLYLNRWIELWSKGTLREGVHYQCMFYGGRLLAHISAGDPELSERHIPILRLNRNAAIVIDSDRKTDDDQPNETKKRIAAEIADVGGMVWITDGRDIENYIPAEAIAQYYEKSDVNTVERFQDFVEYIDCSIGPGEGKKFDRNKVEFAASVCPMMTKDNLSNSLDLRDRLNEICSNIRKWNSIDND